MPTYLIRHGEAVPENVDPNRPLSKQGVAEVTDSMMRLAAGAPRIDEIWHSSKLRAKQTAEIAAKILGVKKVIEKEGLKPNDPVAPVAELLKSTKKTILIAGHMPFLGKLVSYLKTGFEDKEKFDFGSGQALVVSD
jgi:phosphohistidine phosphatase